MGTSIGRIAFYPLFALGAFVDHPNRALARRNHRMAHDIRDLADEEVMQLVQRGDPRAFELLYDRHGGAAYSLAYRIVGKQATAEDVVQEALLSIWRSRLRYDQTRGSVRNWILGIVHNRAIDGLRRSSTHDRRREPIEGIEERFEARERTDVEVARREEARTVRGARSEEHT